MSQSEITAPLPGTFYRRESPTAPNYVEVGQQVSPGDTIGLIEVMKMFTPVTATEAGTVVEIVVDDEDLVEVGQALIRIERSS